MMIFLVILGCLIHYFFIKDHKTIWPPLDADDYP
jgi:hypothetical protein